MAQKTQARASASRKKPAERPTAPLTLASGPGRDSFLAAEIEAIGARLHAAEDELEANAVRQNMLFLRLDQIVPDPNNPRRDVDADEQTLLADSIAEHGLLQNLVVRAEADFTGDRHELVAGERRWRAIAQLFAEGRWPQDREIPCRPLAGLDPKARAVNALVENLVRRDLKPLEEARAFKALRDDHAIATDEIAGRINRTQRFVQQRLQLLDLPQKDQDRLDKGELTIEQARQRVANLPTALAVSPEAYHLLAELLHKIAAEPIGHRVDATEVSEAAKGDPLLAELDARYVVGSVSELYDDGRNTGKYYVSVRNYYVNDPTKALLPQVATPYRTEWLNGPFVISAERMVEIEAHNQARDRLDEEMRQGQRDRAEAWAAQQATTTALRQTARGEATPEIAAGIAEAMAVATHPLPWCAVDRGQFWDLLDACGNRVLRDVAYNGRDSLLYQALAIAANTAAGLPTPETAPEPEPEQAIDGSDPEADDDADDIGGGVEA